MDEDELREYAQASQKYLEANQFLDADAKRENLRAIARLTQRGNELSVTDPNHQRKIDFYIDKQAERYRGVEGVSDMEARQRCTVEFIERCVELEKSGQNAFEYLDGVVEHEGFDSSARIDDMSDDDFSQEWDEMETQEYGIFK